MQIFQKVFRHVTRRGFHKNFTYRNFVLYSEQFDVKPFCNLNITCPFNIELNSLDIYKYVNYDKVFVRLESDVPPIMSQANIKCSQVDDTININGGDVEFRNLLICTVEAPMKASVNVTTTKGNIILNNFNGDHIVLKTDSGNIYAENCYCDKVHLSSNSGNITCNSVMQAAQIYLETKKSGCITTKRLQGLNLLVTTEDGKIMTESSYCNNSTFLSKNGELDLRNTHKNVCIHITNKGILKMSGFDGTLHALLKEGDADIQISKSLGDSDITIDEKGSLNIKLLDTCQEDTELQINCKKLFVDEDVQLKLDSPDVGRGYYLKPKSVSASNVQINCKNGNVNIHSSSWGDMFNLL